MEDLRNVRGGGHKLEIKQGGGTSYLGKQEGGGRERPI